MRRIIIAAALALGLGVVSQAQAGAASDALGKCLVQSSSGKDRTAFVQWMFVALAANPDVQPFSKATSEDQARVSKGAAAVFERLILTDCRKESVAAVREGGNVFSLAFEQFGRAAVGDMLSDPATAAVFTSLDKYTDRAKFADLAAEATKKP